MKIIRWLLSHLFLIFLIVVVIYGYMFWGNLAGENTPAGKALTYLSNEFVAVEEFVSAVKSKQAQLSEEKASAEKTPTESLSSQDMASQDMSSQERHPDMPSQAIPSQAIPSQERHSEIASQEMKEADEQQVDTATPVVPQSQISAAASTQDKAAMQVRDIAQQPVSISYSHNQKRVKQNSAGEIEMLPMATVPATLTAIPIATTGAKQAIEPKTLPNSQGEGKQNRVKLPVTPAEKFVSIEVEQQLENVNRHGQVIDKVLQGNVIRETWITARKSFYQRNYELSEQSYKAVIASTTDNFDAFGELGNVYFNQGKKALAAQAYFEAASILVNKGEIQRAKSLVGLLRSLDRSKANELQQLIESAKS